MLAKLCTVHPYHESKRTGGGCSPGGEKSNRKIYNPSRKQSTKGQDPGEELLSLLPKNREKSIRIGITGVPGAGKSTFIETFGLFLISRGLRVAVLAVDPTSPITGGSILGDKTRMPRLTTHAHAFIRPSPSGGTLGGVTSKTRESILLFEAAGFDVILIETVGVGQSETSVSEMTDFFLLILIAGAGDELQGIKKGIVEMADLILINKADSQNTVAAELARNEYRSALHFLKSRRDYWRADVLTISSLYNLGIDSVWETIERFREISGKKLMENRSLQREKWLREATESYFLEELDRITDDSEYLKKVKEMVSRGEISIREATRIYLEEFKKT